VLRISLFCLGTSIAVHALHNRLIWQLIGRNRRHFRKLVIDANDVTSAMLDSLSRCPNLQTLSANMTQWNAIGLTEAFLDAVNACPLIDTLDVGGDTTAIEAALGKGSQCACPLPHSSNTATASLRLSAHFAQGG
jgi:hypothetical protein